MFIENNQLIMKNNGIEITSDSRSWEILATKYGVPISETRLIDFNRTGIFLPNEEVRPDYRVRFMAGDLGQKEFKTWFALPVRRKGDSNFQAKNDLLSFGDEPFANIGQILLDTCDTNYQRGPQLLNLNSRSRGNCGGCTACVHNYKDLYDKTVLKDQQKLVTKEEIVGFFDKKEKEGLVIGSLKQIAVVTGLFGSEANVVEHMKLINEVVEPRGFKGELMYFGCEVNSESALTELAALGNFSLIYAIDNFTKRKEILARKKSEITVEKAARTLRLARQRGIETSFAYISGIDSLAEMKTGMEILKDSVTRFPVINIYQVQTLGQISIMDVDAKKLEYYIQARKVAEEVFKNSGLSPRRWENYRPLWYEIYNGEKLTNDAFGR